MAYYSPYITGWHFIPYIQQITRVSAGHCSNEFRGFWHIFLHVLVSLPRLGCAKAYLALALAQQRTRGDFTRLTPNDLGDWWLFLGIKAQERLWCFTHPDLNQISQIHQETKILLIFSYPKKNSSVLVAKMLHLERYQNSTHEASEGLNPCQNERPTLVTDFWDQPWQNLKRFSRKIIHLHGRFSLKCRRFSMKKYQMGVKKTKKQIRLGSVQYFCCFQL